MYLYKFILIKDQIYNVLPELLPLRRYRHPYKVFFFFFALTVGNKREVTHPRAAEDVSLGRVRV